jgi:glucoamylase
MRTEKYTSSTETVDACDPTGSFSADGTSISIGNCGGTHPKKEILNDGFLELVRFSIFEPNDQAIRKTLEEYDSVIRVDTPKGPGFYRYNYDGYGEKADGSDCTGYGRRRKSGLSTGLPTVFE